MRNKEDRKIAKKILKIAKKHPELYTPAELSYARMIKRLTTRAMSWGFLWELLYETEESESGGSSSSGEGSDDECGGVN